MLIHSLIIGGTIITFAILISLVINKRRLQPLVIPKGMINERGAEYSYIFNTTMVIGRKVGYTPEYFSMMLVMMLVHRMKDTIVDMDKAVSVVPLFMDVAADIWREGYTSGHITFNETWDFVLEEAMETTIAVNTAKSVPFKFDDMPPDTPEMVEKRKKFAEIEEKMGITIGDEATDI